MGFKIRYYFEETVDLVNILILIFNFIFGDFIGKPPSFLPASCRG